MSVNGVPSIEPERLHALRDAGRRIDLIDVRTPAEYRGEHADLAVSVPLGALDPAKVAAARHGSDEDPIYVICRSGARGRKACEEFRNAGFENVVNVNGGTEAWNRAGLPMVRGKSVMSLERQVRIAAGALVFGGAALTVFVHPYWLALPAFVGAGLVFAGVTNTCGMGMLLAKMPWNNACAREVS